MTTNQIECIKRSWQQVALLDAVAVGQLFYGRLFTANPELTPLFKGPAPEQSKKLLSMISYIVAKLDKPEVLIPAVQKLAMRHVHYGVEEKHYGLVGAALIWTLQQGLKDCWNNELEEAWATCYALLASAMIDASQEVQFV